MHQGEVVRCERERCRGNITAYARKKTRSDPKRSRERDSGGQVGVLFESWSIKQLEREREAGYRIRG